MQTWPDSVTISDEGLQTLIKMLKTTYKEIVLEINSATNFGVANRKVILSQIDDHLQSLGVDVNEFLKEEIPAYYKEGANTAVMQLNDIGAPIKVGTGFNVVHREALAALVSDASTSIAEAMQGVRRSAQALLGSGVRAQLTQNIASGIAKGDALRVVKSQIKTTLAEDGLTALKAKAYKTKSGKTVSATWSLDDYAEMLFRTKVVEARNLGMVNRMAENGYDLVQVSAHGAIDVCGKWENKILSTTGATKEFDGSPVPTVDDAMGDGLFHPNCKHAINAIAVDLARETVAYNPATGDYEKGSLNRATL